MALDALGVRLRAEDDDRHVAEEPSGLALPQQPRRVLVRQAVVGEHHVEGRRSEVLQSVLRGVDGGDLEALTRQCLGDDAADVVVILDVEDFRRQHP